MKRLFSVILLISLLALSACVPHGGEPKETAAPTQAQTPEPSQEPEEEFDDRFCDTTMNLLDLGDSYIWSAYTYGRYIYYHDKNTGVFDVLCSKPECMHDRKKLNQSCGGYVDSPIPCISYYGGKLYFIAWYKEPGSQSRPALMRMEPDSTRRELVKFICLPEYCVPAAFVINRGRLYLFAKEQRVIGGLASVAVDIFTSELSDDELVNIYHNDPGSGFMPAVFMRCVDKYLYFLCGTQPGSEPTVMCEINRYDPESGELSMLFEPTEVGQGSILDFWAEDDETFYFSRAPTWGSEEPCEVCIVLGGNAEHLLDTMDAGAKPERYGVCLLGKNAVYSLARVNNEDGSCIWHLWVRSFDGETIAKGALPFSFRDELDRNNAGLFLNNGGGDDTVFIAEFFNIAYNTAASEQIFYLVRYELDGGCLNETLLAYTIG